MVGEKLFNYVRKCPHNAVKNAFESLVLSYAGKDGLLDVHRKKAYCYATFSLLGGEVVRIENNVSNETNQPVK